MEEIGYVTLRLSVDVGDVNIDLEHEIITCSGARTAVDVAAILTQGAEKLAEKYANLQTGGVPV